MKNMAIYFIYISIVFFPHIYNIYSKLRAGTWQLSALIAVHNHKYTPFLYALHLPLLSPVNSLPLLLLLLASPSLNSWRKTQWRWETCSVSPTFLQMRVRVRKSAARGKHKWWWMSNKVDLREREGRGKQTGWSLRVNYNQTQERNG